MLRPLGKVCVALSASVALAAPGCACGASTKEPRDVGARPNDDDGTPEVGHEGDDDTIPSSPSTAHGAGGDALIAEANRIVAQAKASTYSHKTFVDEAAGRYDLDCSGLVDYVLARVAPDALETLRAAEVKRPLAKHFVDFFASIPSGQKKGRWRRVERASELAPGDVVAWRKPADVTTNNTGHVMIVRGPVVVSKGEVAVPIVDSTSERHGADDSRFASKATGVGFGTIHLVVDEGGAPVGYRWSNGKKARDHATSVALGRLD